MRGKSPLVIMELAVMLLVFALAAALCLGVFALAEDISAETAERDRACLMAQNCAETLHWSGGDFAAAAEKLGGDWDGESLRLSENGLELSAVETESGHELLGAARISVCGSGGEEIFALDCGWQRGGGSGE